MENMEKTELLSECINIVSDPDLLLDFSGSLLVAIDSYFLCIGRCLEFECEEYDKMMMAQDNFAHVANLLGYVVRKSDLVDGSEK